MQGRRMFWLVHLHNEGSFQEFNFAISLNMESRRLRYSGKNFSVMQWMGRSKQFIEKWKSSPAHVFLDYKGHIFFLAGKAVSLKLGGPFKKGEYALCYLTRDDFVAAVNSCEPA